MLQQYIPICNEGKYPNFKRKKNRQLFYYTTDYISIFNYTYKIIPYILHMVKNNNVDQK